MKTSTTIFKPTMLCVAFATLLTVTAWQPSAEAQVRVSVSLGRSSVAHTTYGYSYGYSRGVVVHSALTPAVVVPVVRPVVVPAVVPYPHAYPVVNPAFPGYVTPGYRFYKSRPTPPTEIDGATRTTRHYNSAAAYHAERHRQLKSMAERHREMLQGRSR